ncbi:hypothetical protein STEG23_004522 [Scotinomys teguina]
MSRRQCKNIGNSTKNYMTPSEPMGSPTTRPDHTNAEEAEFITKNDLQKYTPGTQEHPDAIHTARYENLIFGKDAKTVKWKKESIFNKWCWHNWMSTCRRLQIDPYLSPCTKLKSKWIKDLNINRVTLNLIEEKVGSTLERIGTGDQFLNITPTAQTLSATINQLDYMKLRSFCKAKDTITKTKHQPTEWKKIFTNPTSDRGLISRIYKEVKKHDIKTPNSPIEKWAKELNREFTAEY